jgi:hypothetical protein
MESTRLVVVADYWKHNNLGDTWYSWKSTHDDLNIPPQVNIQLG